MINKYQPAPKLDIQWCKEIRNVEIQWLYPSPLFSTRRPSQISTYRPSPKPSKPNTHWTPMQKAAINSEPYGIPETTGLSWQSTPGTKKKRKKPKIGNSWNELDLHSSVVHSIQHAVTIQETVHGRNEIQANDWNPPESWFQYICVTHIPCRGHWRHSKVADSIFNTETSKKRDDRTPLQHPENKQLTKRKIKI